VGLGFPQGRGGPPPKKTVFLPENAKCVIKPWGGGKVVLDVSFQVRKGKTSRLGEKKPAAKPHELSQVEKRGRGAKKKKKKEGRIKKESFMNNPHRGKREERGGKKTDLVREGKKENHERKGQYNLLGEALHLKDFKRGGGGGRRGEKRGVPSKPIYVILRKSFFYDGKRIENQRCGKEGGDQGIH